MPLSRRALVLCLGAATACLVYDPLATAADPKRLAMLLLAIVVLSGLVRRRDPRVSPALALWVAFVAWSAVSLAWGAPAGILDVGTWIGATALAALALALPVAEARHVAELVALIAGSGAAAAALLQAAHGRSGLAIHGGQGNPNWLGLLLALSLPLTIAVLARLWPARRRAALAVAALALSQLPALWLARSRVGFVAAGAGLLLLLGMSRRAAGASRAATAAAALVIVATVAVLGVAPTRVTDSDAPASVSLRGRLWIWRTSLEAGLAGLPAGVGLGRFGQAFLEAQGKRLAELQPRVAARRFVNATTAHDDWLQALVESGPLGLALLALAIALGLHGAREWPGGAAALVALAVCAVGDSPLRQPAIVVLLGLLLAGAPRTLRLPRSGALALHATLLVAAALLLALGAASWRSGRMLAAARDAAPLERLRLLERAAALDTRSGEAALTLGLARLELGDTAGALSELQRSRSLIANVGTDVAIGNAHLQRGDALRAVEAYERALRLHPGSFRARANLAEALRRLDRLDDAAAQLRVARALQPGHPKLPELEERLRDARHR